MGIKTLLLIGAGGHAWVVLDSIRKCNPDLQLEIRDDNISLEGQEIAGIPIKTPVGEISSDFLVHVAIGNNTARQRLCNNLLLRGISLYTIIHPDAMISPFAQIAHGCFIAARSVVAPQAHLGIGVIINHGSIIDHHCDIKKFSHIAPNVTLGGSVQVGQNCLVGASATVLPKLIIGDNATIGAGAVVTKNVSQGQLVLGVPARSK
jgi:sugar O-acyltransferase (sialic acid O-acetyltransferase NeuD family)